MYDLEKVKKLESESNAALREMNSLVNALTGQIDLYQADSSRSGSFNKERIQAARDKALPAISKQHEIIDKIAKELQTQKPFYSSKPLILSLAAFNDDPVKDAVIRMNIGRELAAAPLALLKLALESATADKDLPMIYQGFLAANARNDEFRKAGGGMNIDLDSVDIPDQLAGLAAISQAWGNIKLAEFPLVDAIGARVSPYKRLDNINTRDAALKDANDNRTAATAATAARAGI